MIPSSVFFMSVIVSFNSNWFFFILFSSLEVLTMLIHSSLELSEHIYDHYFDPLLGRLLTSILPSSFPSEIVACSFVWHILLCHLLLPDSACFCVFSESAVSLCLRGVAAYVESFLRGSEEQSTWSPVRCSGAPLSVPHAPSCRAAVVAAGALVGGLVPSVTGCEAWLPCLWEHCRAVSVVFKPLTSWCFVNGSHRKLT